jgi:inosine-uridine nucleoside N-ribohydrolase
MDQMKVWLDCDPGHDDMLAIIMAALNERIDLIGISTSAGNSVIENTTQNALNILY